MTNGINLDLGSAFVYLEDKVRAAVGYDHASLHFRQIVDKHLNRAVHEASGVQIIGMDRPVSIFDIYQPTLLVYPWRQETNTVAALVHDRESAVIFGGPGRGKTILLHHTFATVARKAATVPLLFTLRWQNATNDLRTFVDHLVNGKALRQRTPILLLVDGMDEISPEERRIVAESLRDFAALRRGSFLLTCRTFYHVDDIIAQRVEIAPFTRSDSRGFVLAFSRCYGVPIDVDELLQELDQHGFADFASHPLMLAMICILKSGPMPELPQTPLRLIQRAISTLTLRWDDAKGVQRFTRLPIDGEDRVRTMMSVAHAMTNLYESATTVERIVEDFLKRLQRQSVSAISLLLEIAQWYGVLVPASEMQWTFVHRTIHDYLAAKEWVESGRYAASTVKEWNSRAAYAACLAPDATESIIEALQKSRDLGPVLECFYNNALFDAAKVAHALDKHFDRIINVSKTAPRRDIVDVIKTTDFFNIVSITLLEALVQLAATERTNTRDVLLAYSLAELKRRKHPLPPSLGRLLRKAYGDDVFDIERGRGAERITIREFY